MPRVTRKSLVESPADSQARMSPRASTKASTTSSRISRSTTASTSTASPRTPRTRGAKSPGGEDQPAEKEVVKTRTASRGRQQKPAGDAGTPDEAVPEKTGRGRTSVKVEAKAAETGRSRSRAKPAKNETPKQTEESSNTSSRSRSRTKTEEKPVAESARVSRSKLKGKEAEDSEEKETPGRASSRSRSSNKDQTEETKVTNRSRKGGKADDGTKAESNQTKSRSRSRTKAEPKESPEVEAEASRSRGKGRAPKSPTNESVGSSRSSSRSRTSKAQSEDISEPVEVKEEESKAKSKSKPKPKPKPKPSGSVKAASKTRGVAKDVVEEQDEKSDVTPAGRRSGRGRKVEASPSTPTKKRKVEEKSVSPADDKDEDAAEDEAAEQLKKRGEEKMEEEDDKKEKIEVADESEKQETDPDKKDMKESDLEIEKKTGIEESMEIGNELDTSKPIEDMGLEEQIEAEDESKLSDSKENEFEEPNSPEIADIEEKSMSPADIEPKLSAEEVDSKVTAGSALEVGPKPPEVEEDKPPAEAEEEEESQPAAVDEECRPDAVEQVLEPAVVEKDCQPDAVEEKLESDAADEECQSDAAEEECQSDAMEEECQPDAVKEKVEPAADAVEEELEPAASDEESQSDAIEEECQPDAVEEELEPAAVEEECRPDAVEEVLEPAAAGEECQSDTVEEEDQPDAVEEKLEPATEEKELVPIAVEEQCQPDAVEEECRPSAVDEQSEPDAVDEVENVLEPTGTAAEREAEMSAVTEVSPVEEEDKEEFKTSVEEPEASTEEVEEESKSPVEEAADNSHKVALETEELMNSEEKQVENMDFDETDIEPVTSNQISSSGGHGQKRKLDDDAFEESSNKRVCVDDEKEQEQVVEPALELTGSSVGDTPQAVVQETSQPEESMVHMVQQPAIEAISDVSSAEEDMTCSSDVQKETVSQPTGAVSSHDTWQMPPVMEAQSAAVENIDQVTVSGQKPTVSETVELPMLGDSSHEAITEPSSEEMLQADSVDTGKTTVEETPQTTSESVEASVGKESAEQESVQQKDEDLTASYVVVSMDDVPQSDSALVKDILPNHQNHTDNDQIVDNQHHEQESMEVDPGLTADEQNKTVDLTDTAAKTDSCEIDTEHNTMSKLSATTLPVADPLKESIKPDISIVKPVRNFEPCPDIFHRSCVRNPALGPVSVPETHKFSVASYNILAECHRKRGDYSYTEERFLEQEYRHQLLLRELQYLDADIVCLQEVNPEYYNTHLQPALQRNGYQGFFMKRTWTAMDEGEATFFKISRFSVESTKGFSLAELSKKNISESGLSTEVQAAVEEYLDQADVVNICRLKCKQTDKVLTVGNIHVVYDHLRSPDIQSIQIATAVKEVVTQAGSDSCPHILCGDFNSVPSSVGYQLAQDGYLTDSNIATLQAVENLKLQSGSKALVNHLWGAFQHTSSNLTSAYHTCQGEEPEITTFTRNMFECVDYLLYGSLSLGVEDVLRVVDKRVVEDCKGLPAQDIPSDHLSLKSTFFFK